VEKTAITDILQLLYAVADLGEGPRAPPPLIFGKKKITTGRKANRVSKKKHRPPLSLRSGSTTDMIWEILLLSGKSQGI